MDYRSSAAKSLRLVTGLGYPFADNTCFRHMSFVNLFILQLVRITQECWSLLETDAGLHVFDALNDERSGFLWTDLHQRTFSPGWQCKR